MQEPGRLDYLTPPPFLEATLAAGARPAAAIAPTPEDITRQKPKLIVRYRQAIRTRQYSRRTEEAYVHWVRRYIYLHNLRHPTELGTEGVRAFLTHLAVDLHVVNGHRKPYQVGHLIPYHPGVSGRLE